MKVKNIALTIACLSLAIGFTDFQENIVFWLGRPVGAIFLIVYFIFALLDKEYALFDEQQRNETQAVKAQSKAGSPAVKECPAV